MNNLSYKFAAAIASVSLAGVAAAQEVNPNSTALSFLSRNSDPVTLSMGGASLATSHSPAYSLFCNPSAMAFSEKKLDIAASFSSWQPEGAASKVIDFGASGCFGKFGISAGISYGKGDEYEVYSESGDKSGTFSPSEMAAGVGLSYRIVKFLSAGVNLKYASEKLSKDDSYNAFAADVLLTAKLDGFRIAAGARNIGSKVKASDGTSFSIPSSIAAGVSYGHTFAEKHSILASVNADYYFESGATESIGVAYTYNNLVSVRGGYCNASDKAPGASFASVGAGVQFLGIRIDAAYLIAGSDSPMKNTLSVGLGFSF